MAWLFGFIVVTIAMFVVWRNADAYVPERVRTVMRLLAAAGLGCVVGLAFSPFRVVVIGTAAAAVVALAVPVPRAVFAVLGGTRPADAYMRSLARGFTEGAGMPIAAAAVLWICALINIGNAPSCTDRVGTSCAACHSPSARSAWDRAIYGDSPPPRTEDAEEVARKASDRLDEIDAIDRANWALLFEAVCLTVFALYRAWPSSQRPRNDPV